MCRLTVTGIKHLVSVHTEAWLLDLLHCFAAIYAYTAVKGKENECFLTEYELHCIQMPSFDAWRHVVSKCLFCYISRIIQKQFLVLTFTLCTVFVFRNICANQRSYVFVTIVAISRNASFTTSAWYKGCALCVVTSFRSASLWFYKAETGVGAFLGVKTPRNKI